MSNYPDDFSQDLFNSCIGSRFSMEEEALEGHIANTEETVRKAFKEFPLDLPSHYMSRWVIIRKNGLDKAYACMDLLTDLNNGDKAELLLELQFACDANTDFDLSALNQCIESYMNVFRNAIERKERA